MPRGVAKQNEDEARRRSTKEQMAKEAHEMKVSPCGLVAWRRWPNREMPQ